jgi:hypothetical protein
MPGRRKVLSFDLGFRQSIQYKRGGEGVPVRQVQVPRILPDYSGKIGTITSIKGLVPHKCQDVELRLPSAGNGKAVVLYC